MAVFGAAIGGISRAFIAVDPGSPEVVPFTYKVYNTSEALVETETVSYNLTANNLLSLNSAAPQSASGTLTVMPRVAEDLSAGATARSPYRAALTITIAFKDNARTVRKPKVERAMGIGYITGFRLQQANQIIATGAEHCV